MKTWKSAHDVVADERDASLRSFYALVELDEGGVATVRVKPQELRILVALLDAMVADWEWEAWRVLGHVETAINRERPAAAREGWSATKTEQYLEAHGWKTAADVYDAVGIPEDHRVVLDREALGWTDKEISRFLDIPIRTVQRWLYDGREAMDRFAKINPLEMPRGVAVFSGVDTGVLPNAPIYEDTP